jgi:hypothetical protein
MDHYFCGKSFLWEVFLECSALASQSPRQILDHIGVGNEDFLFYAVFWIDRFVNPTIYNSLRRPLFILIQETFNGFTLVTFAKMGLIVFLYERRQKGLIEHGVTSITGAEYGSPVVQKHASFELSPPTSSKVSYLKVLAMVLENEMAVRCLENYLLKEFSAENLYLCKPFKNCRREQSQMKN